MTICSPAQKTKSIPSCTDEIVIGKISDHNAAVTVYLVDLTTKRNTIFETESSSDGTVSIDTTDAEFAENHAYELYITKANEQTKQDITIGSDTAETIQLVIEDINEGDSYYQVATVTLELA